MFNYVERTDNYVLYRVTTYFDKDNQLVYGVQMEARFFNKENEEDKEECSLFYGLVKMLQKAVEEQDVEWHLF